jgi:hypothetical protein
LILLTGIPHNFDSVELTNLSFGLLMSHIAAFCCGQVTVTGFWSLRVAHGQGSNSKHHH